MWRRKWDGTNCVTSLVDDPLAVTDNTDNGRCSIQIMAFICFQLCVDESRWQRTAFSNRLWPSWQVLIYCTNVSRPQINCRIWTTNAFALSPIKMQKVWSKINKWFVTVINYNLCKTLLISEWSMNLILNFFFDGLFYFFAYCNAASWLSSKSLASMKERGLYFLFYSN